MQMLHPQEANIPTYNFKVHKYIFVSSSRVIFSAHTSRRHGLGPFHYCVCWQDLSKFLSRDPNGASMQMLHPLEVSVPTYHFVVRKVVIFYETF